MNLDFLYDVQCDESAAWIQHNYQPVEAVDPSDNQERNDWQDREDDLQQGEDDDRPDRQGVLAEGLRLLYACYVSQPVSVSPCAQRAYTLRGGPAST